MDFYMRQEKEMRNYKRVVYTSSYDRGLEHLLKLWSDVVKEVPDATLDIYYGWQLFDKFYSGNPASMKWKEKMLEMMKAKGITDRGRIPQPQLKEEMLQSGIWAYPTHFGEINCISAIKAQAYGCEPVIVNYAALRETVQYGRRVEGDIYDFETQEKFKQELIAALQTPMPEKARKEMMAWAQKKYAWEEVAKQWSKEFRR
jgi:glycosyltransferase involved in cell wall biosynthesis